MIDFAVPGDNIGKIKENERREKFVGLAKELRKLWGMKMTVLPIVIGALGMVSKSLEKELDELEIGWRIKTI